MLLGQNTEDENVKKVIRAETEAYYKFDADAWQNTWIHSPKATATYGLSNLNEGWDSFGPEIVTYLKNNHSSGLVDLKNDSFNITTYGNMAWVQYKQVTTAGPADSAVTRKSQEYRVLVKENNEWKILSMITQELPGAAGPSAQDIEISLNTTGYNLITAKRLNDAIDVFKLNVKLHPKAWNTYDSLGESLAMAGKKKEAIMNYEMSVKLNPKK